MNKIVPYGQHEPFEINKTRGEGLPIARLPTFGTVPRHHLDMQFPMGGVDDYLAALHQSMGDHTGQIETSLAAAAKSLGVPVPQAHAYARLSFLPDPANYGLCECPGIQPESLRKVAQENLLPQLIFRARANDIRRYSSLSTHLWSPGWRIVMRDASATPSKQTDKDIQEAEKYLWNCSREDTFSDPRVRDQNQISNFEEYLVAMVNDTFTFDGWATWTDKDYTGKIRKFANIPAGLIRLAYPATGYRNDPKFFAAMIDEVGTPVAPFTRDELVWKVRNPRNDPAVLDYGWSEIEMAIRVIQGYQAAIDLNVDTFTKSSIPNGMLILSGDFWQQQQIDALMREWTNLKRGISKMWGMPVMAVPENGKVELMEFMKLKDTDVRYKDHMNMMIGVFCIMTGFPIRRLGLFASGNHRDNEPAQDQSVETQGIDDPGLPSLLIFIENTINEYLLQPNYPNLKFMFMGKNPKEDARAYEGLKLARTWKESRAEADLPALTKDCPDWATEMMEIMEFCPEDSSKMGVFQTLAQVALEEKLGVNDKPEGAGVGNSAKTPGAPYPSKKDPAQSQAHGHRAGVRRSGSAERVSAGTDR